MFFRKKRPDESQSVAELFNRVVRENNASCELYHGLGEEQITGFLDDMKMPIPKEYLEILSISNGADFFDRSFSLFGFHLGDPPYSIGDIRESTQWYQDNTGLSSNYLVFGQRLDGTVFIIDLSGKRARYVVWNPESDEIEHESYSFSDWFTSEIGFWVETLKDI